MKWQDYAKCADTDSDIFFLKNSGAIKYCFSCPVKQECRDYAVATNSVGVWGGTDYMTRSKEVDPVNPIRLSWVKPEPVDRSLP